jgi:hypothetical protein
MEKFSRNSPYLLSHLYSGPSNKMWSYLVYISVRFNNGNVTTVTANT